MARKRLVPKSREIIKEAVDIIKNTENDEAAISFLRDTLEDDYPNLDLGRMNLHEAVNSLNVKEYKKSTSIMNVENLNETLGDFINIQKNRKNNNSKKNKKPKTKRRRRKK